MPRLGSLLLEVYQSGGVDVDWSVSTDEDHFRPYLIGPTNYEGQEIDPVSAAATIGTVDVGVIDPATIPGQQDSGWMTARIGTIRGKRNRLRRWDGDVLGYVVVADGPAGTPRLDASYAAYRWPIRDTREIERKTQLFHKANSTAIAPRGPINGFGLKPDDSFLLDPVTPLVGVYQYDEDLGLRRGQVVFDWGGPIPPAEFVVDEAGEEATRSQSDGNRGIHPNADILWRIAGSDDPWNVARPIWPAPFSFSGLGLANIVTVIDGDDEYRALQSVILFLQPIGAVPDGTEPLDGSEVDGADIEVILRYRGSASDDYPFYYEGTAGEFLADLYDGKLSGIDELSEAARLAGELYDPAGLQAIAALLAGGIKYDPDSLEAMTARVCLRATDSEDDARDFAERKIYGPTGFIPALDTEGAISVVSRARPASVDGPLLNQAIAEPTSEWNGGERVVTAIQMTYDRYFIGPQVEIEPDGLAIQEVNLSYVDAEAEAAEGQHPVEFDGSAFSAIGDEVGQPLEGDVEPAAFLAQEARYEVLQRYRAGAQAIRVRVRRVDVPFLRIGDWCPAQLPWLPNTMTGLRGLDLPAVQVLSIDDSEHAWRYLLIEESSVSAPPGYFSDGFKLTDVEEPGYFEGFDVISDEESP